MSEYYARGRAVFADATSFACFILGFLGAGPFAWPALRVAFENGQYDRGLAVFIARIFGSGLAAGMFGYVAGTLAGRLWQAWHQWRRARRQSAASRAIGTGDGAVDDAPSAANPARPSMASKRATAPMTCRVGPLTPSNHAAFSRRLTDRTLDQRYMESATTEILTLAAWDGLDIAGVARLLSDGHGALFITDFVVDPHYVAADVEQALIDGALDRVPRGGRLTRV